MSENIRDQLLTSASRAFLALGHKDIEGAQIELLAILNALQQMEIDQGFRISTGSIQFYMQKAG